MITSKWAETLPKLTVYYEEHVKDKYSRKLLTSVKGITDTNSKDCIYFMLLHSILKPTHRYIIKEGELKVHRKATIQNSVSSSILHITSVNDLQHQMELRRNKSIESKTPIQPFSIVVGSDLLSLTDFYVSFRYQKFKFSSFIISLDICFKIYQIFSLKYPDESHHVWSFLQHYFYDISTPYDVKKPCVNK
ncbi:PREDICTED: uncharacterized protein LOC108364063 [Rhagoletis zephyria]|uniref:uncharacterized protein LOC108364063 n=1 Tax=Rhagoletis zephyria TaxID=28612 RepID=UPI0008112C32|nr:PREDICTED: uncharacterized protein LOC108364063 [Rhagoletis zephyria]XP_036339198.1 uncharacterized protein LOC118748691 [Rhagoletis pomonella]